MKITASLIFLLFFSTFLIAQQPKASISTKKIAPITSAVGPLYVRDTVFIKQLPNDRIIFEQATPTFDASIWIALLALLVSVVSIWLPIRANKRADQRATFFKMYELWNSEKISVRRERFWKQLEEKKIDGKVDLLNLYSNSREMYYDYENIYDVLSDLSTLYFDKSADKKLTAYFFYTFINSYGDALEKLFIYHKNSKDEIIKMNRSFYSNVIDLRNDVNAFRARKKGIIPLMRIDRVLLMFRAR